MMNNSNSGFGRGNQPQRQPNMKRPNSNNQNNISSQPAPPPPSQPCQQPQPPTKRPQNRPEQKPQYPIRPPRKPGLPQQKPLQHQQPSQSQQPQQPPVPNPNKNQLDNLANIASKHLGTSPDELKKAAQNGNVQNLLSNMSPMQAQQIQKILSDENAAKKLLSTPQAQELLRRLSKNE